MRGPELLDALGPHDPVLIVDDICDGGRTFPHLGRFLRGRTDGKLRLFVTHGIFSQGLGESRTVFDDVRTANLFDHALAHAVTILPPPAAEKESGR